MEERTGAHIYDNYAERLGKRVTRKVQGNTYLQRRDENTIAIKYHDTDVVTFKSNGDIVLDSGGWLTVSTKERMNGYAPFVVYSDHGQWFVSLGWQHADRPSFAYHDGMTVRLLPDESLMVDGETAPDTEIVEVMETERKEIDKLILKYTKLLPAKIKEWQEEIKEHDGLSNAGDPWCCTMVAADGTHPLRGNVRDHWLKHFKDDYVFPTLVIEALRAGGSSDERIGLWFRCGYTDSIVAGVRAFLRAELYPPGFSTKNGRRPSPDRQHEIDNPSPPKENPFPPSVLVISDVANAHYNGEEVPEIVVHPETGESVGKPVYRHIDTWRGYWEIEPMDGWQHVGGGCDVGDYDDAPLGMSSGECKAEIIEWAEQYGEVVVVLCGGSNVMAMQYDVLARVKDQESVAAGSGN